MFLHRIRYVCGLQTVRTIKCHLFSSTLPSGSKRSNARKQNKDVSIDNMLSDSSSWRGGHQKWTKSPYRIRQLRFSRHIMNLVHKGKMAEAVEVFELMRKNGVKPETVVYNSLIGGFGKQGNIRESFRMFSQVYFNLMNQRFW